LESLSGVNKKLVGIPLGGDVKAACRDNAVFYKYVLSGMSGLVVWLRPTLRVSATAPRRGNGGGFEAK